MPRLFTSTSEPVDFCSRHFPGERLAEDRFGNLGDGPDGRGNCFAYDADHPPYEDQYPEYRCATCRAKLGEKDNDARV